MTGSTPPAAWDTDRARLYRRGSRWLVQVTDRSGRPVGRASGTTALSGAHLDGCKGQRLRVFAATTRALVRDGLAPVHLFFEPEGYERKGLEGLGFARRTDWIAVGRDLDGWVPSEYGFERRRLVDHREEAEPILASLLEELPDRLGADVEAGLADRVVRADGDVDRGAWVLVWRDGRAAGAILPHVHEGTGVFLLLGLAPWARGKGWGRELHQLGLSLLVELGAIRYADHTWVENIAMRRLFEQAGCPEVDRFGQWLLAAT